eukprot:1139252-Pelagomonas_calceolata.AAC.4
MTLHPGLFMTTAAFSASACMFILHTRLTYINCTTHLAGGAGDLALQPVHDHHRLQRLCKLFIRRLAVVRGAWGWEGAAQEQWGHGLVAIHDLRMKVHNNTVMRRSTTSSEL